MSWVRLWSGRPSVITTPEAAAEYSFTPSEREIAKSRARSQFIGDPALVTERLQTLVESTECDELIITTMVHGQHDRSRSYELLAQGLHVNPSRPK